ncbi:MAG: outer membrane beta-barrel protein [Saprospiraceae bacterium]|nr:outer membrane beta-barrel protein [Saprospiraceae bacterium]
MKQITLLMALLFLILYKSNAQERDTIILKSGNDTTVVVVKTKKEKAESSESKADEADEPEELNAPEPPEPPAEPEAPESPNRKRELKNVKMRWVMVDYGMSTYVHDGNLNLPPGYPFDAFEQNLWKSSNWNLHLFKMRINAIDHRVNVITGLSFEFYRYNWTNNYVIEGNQAPIIPALLTDENGDVIKFDKNRMYTSFLTIPLMLNYESNPYKSKNSFHLSAGGYIGFKLASNIRLESDKLDRLTKDNFNLNNFRYGLTGQIGYGPITLYANYSMVPLFKKVNQTTVTQPELYPVNFGIQLIGF